MKILILSNLISYTYNFRLEMIEKMISDGHKIVIACQNDDENKRKALSELGCGLIEVPFNGKGKNPVEELRLLFTYIRIIRSEKPEFVFTFTIKMNLYGGLAARRAGVPYVPMITGLGELEKKGKLRAVLLLLHKRVMPYAKAVVFQNKANEVFFRDNGIGYRKAVFVPGSGINLRKFGYCEYPSENDGLRFAFIGRITQAKGISEFLSMAETEKKNHPETMFYVAGLCDEEYRSRISDLVSKGVVDYLGMLSDIRELLVNIHCIILPTYHPEGLSNVLLEACATGRPAICTSRTGCREVVSDGLNGLYCREKDVDDLISVVERFRNMTEDRHRKMGLEGRRIVESSFDRNTVVNTYMEFLT